MPSPRLLLPALLAGAALLFGCPKPRDICSDRRVTGLEECDDGNTVDGDGCEANCTITPVDRPACGNRQIDPGEECDDENQIPGDGCEPDCRRTPQPVCGNGKTEAGEQCDDENQTPGDGCEPDCTSTVVTECPGAQLPEPASGTCEVIPGDANRLITGIVLTAGTVYTGGQVLFDATGTITCAGCDCTQSPGAATATRITCPRGVISPGLINSHDHITFQAAPYVADSEERYEHRHDWRRGNDGHTEINSGGTASNAQIRWAELRQVMAGTTAIAGSGGQNGLLRNLDKASTSSSGGNQEGLGEGASGVRYSTFPLGDSSGTELTTGCGYPNIEEPTVIPGDAAYLPHVAEGIEASARNEFLCLSSNANGGQDLMGSRTAIIHGIGLKAADIGVASARGVSLIWSPRSNVALYGDTAPVTTYLRMGVRIALGTDWVRSGSMNLLRELKCADALNTTFYNRTFSDDQLVRMVTSSAADATHTTEKIGRLEVGKLADIAIFRQSGSETYRSVILAKPEDVVLTVRGGKVLYGDQALVTALSEDSCDPLSVCGVDKAVCLGGETGETFAELAAANASTYPLFFCGEPQDEPTCVPARSPVNVVNQSTPYTGLAASDDADGDGIGDAQDNCPQVFNPIRPLDDGAQPDADGDGAGDACDVCPLEPNSTSCPAPDPNDMDGDGVANAADNCPGDKNPGQEDGDNDGKGDACDACPAPNPGASACPTRIYDIKAGTALVGQQVAVGNALVTAVGPTGFFLQVHEADPGYAGPDHSGIFVYATSPTVSAGDRIDVTTATVSNFFGQLQLTKASYTVLGSGHPLPAPIPVTAAEVSDNGARAETLEAVLVTVSNVTVLDVAPPPGAGDKAPTYEFEVDDGLRVNDYVYRASPFPVLGETFASITGVAELRNGHHKLEPRSAADLVGGPPSVSAFGPSPAYTREGVSGPTFVEPLRVSISRAQPSPVTVKVTAADGSVTVAKNGDVEIPAGQTSAVVELTGVTQTSGVVLTATLGTSNKSATVRVLGASEPAALSALEPGIATVTPSGTVTFTVKLDVPPAVDTPVTLTLDPSSGFGTIPSSVSVLANTLSATFDLVADAGASGSATVTAQLGSETRTATVTLQAGVTGLVINEVDYDNVGTDSAEFVELYNSSNAPISLANLALVFINGASTPLVEYYPLGSTNRVNLVAAGQSLAPGQYLVVGAPSVTASLPAGVLKINFTKASDSVENGPNDAIGIFDTAQEKLVDSLSYEGAARGVSLGSGTFDFTEGSGTVTSLADSNAAPGSIGRSPSGIDTNSTASDFKSLTTPTPGAANP